MKYYAGIGSRKTPKHILDIMTRMARKLHKDGYVLRSGGADGADLAFEKGAGSQKQVFLPWKGFNKSRSTRHNIPKRVIEFSLKYHPAGDKLSSVVKKLMARNAQQVLGMDLDSPVKFLLCWTPFDTEEAFKPGGKIGGTGQAIRIAHDHNIPIYNLRKEDVWRRIVEAVESSESKLDVSH